MATLREFVLAQSTLPTGNTVRDHISNPGSGGGTTIYAIGVYSVTYLGEEENEIFYVAPESISITYVGQEEVLITYLGEQEELVEYIEQVLINMEIVCN